MLRNGLIRLDGAKARLATRLASGQLLRLPPVIAKNLAATNLRHRGLWPGVHFASNLTICSLPKVRAGWR